jgi:transposase-like protein
MGVSRRRFTREFKVAAIQRLEHGISIAEVARAMEVNPTCQWRLKNPQITAFEISPVLAD